MWGLVQVATPTTYHLPPNTYHLLRTYLLIYHLLYVGSVASGDTYRLLVYYLLIYLSTNLLSTIY
jgi:hypothetical protein